MVQIREFRREDGFGDLIALSKDFFQGYEAHHEDFFEIDQWNDADTEEYNINSLARRS